MNDDLRTFGRVVPHPDVVVVDAARNKTRNPLGVTAVAGQTAGVGDYLGASEIISALRKAICCTNPFIAQIFALTDYVFDL